MQGSSVRRLLSPFEEFARSESTGGVTLIGAALLAFVWANSPLAPGYFALREIEFGVGLGGWSLEKPLLLWVNDGLMALFFFLVGLEIKREVSVGELANPRDASLAVFAALGGVVVPASIYAAINWGGEGIGGWGVPMATDIAFALGVMALLGNRVPLALKVFLTALAIVDDLVAVLVIALFYTTGLDLLSLSLSLGVLALAFAYGRRGGRGIRVFALLGVVAWFFMLQSGVHATVAGVLLAFTVPVVRSEAAGGPGAGPGLAEHFEHLIRPLSAGVAVPVFAFFSAGVTVGGLSGLGAALTDSVAVGIIVGLVVGKAVGITAATWLVARFTRAELGSDLGWPDVVGLSLLAGIGFTVSLLIGELAFGAGSLRDEHVKVGVLAATLLAALLATVLLRLRDRRYRRIAEVEARDENADQIPDVFQGPDRDG